MVGFMDLPCRANAVIVGGRLGDHLTLRGCRDVVWLERQQRHCGTIWFGAGLAGQVRACLPKDRRTNPIDTTQMPAHAKGAKSPGADRRRAVDGAAASLVLSGKIELWVSGRHRDNVRLRHQSAGQWVTGPHRNARQRPDLFIARPTRRQINLSKGRLP